MNGRVARRVRTAVSDSAGKYLHLVYVRFIWERIRRWSNVGLTVGQAGMIASSYLALSIVMVTKQDIQLTLRIDKMCQISRDCEYGHDIGP